MTDDLRRTFQDAVGPVGSPPVGDILERSQRIHRSRVRKVTLSGTLALVVLGVAIVALGGHGSHVVDVVASPSTPRATPSATPTPTPSPPATSPPETSVPLTAVDWSVATMAQLDCGTAPPSYPTATIHQVSYLHQGGADLAVVLASCTAGAGSPSEGLFVYDGATSQGRAHLTQTLLDPRLDRLATSFALNGSTITMHEDAYSSWKNVPDCCPDLTHTVQWIWTGHAFAGSPPAATTANPLLVTATARAAERGIIPLTITVTNDGPTPLNAVQVLALPIPCPSGVCAGNAVTWQGGSPNCAPGIDGEGTCTVGSLPPGASAEVSMSMQVQTPTSPMTINTVAQAELPAAGRLGQKASATVPGAN